MYREFEEEMSWKSRFESSREQCVALLDNAVKKSKDSMLCIMKNKDILISAKYREELEVLVSLQKRGILSIESAAVMIRNAPNIQSICEIFEKLSFLDEELRITSIDAFRRYLADIDYSSIYFDVESEFTYLTKILRFKVMKKCRQELICLVLSSKK
jgi:hypothetical protein